MKRLIRNIFVFSIIICSVHCMSNAQYLREAGLKNKINIAADTTKKKIKLTEKSPLLQAV